MHSVDRIFWLKLWNISWPAMQIGDTISVTSISLMEVEILHKNCEPVCIYSAENNLLYLLFQHLWFLFPLLCHHTTVLVIYGWLNQKLYINADCEGLAFGQGCTVTKMLSKSLSEAEIVLNLKLTVLQRIFYILFTSQSTILMKILSCTESTGKLFTCCRKVLSVFLDFNFP